MKNHELLDLIGDVNEDYVQAADSNVARPRFRWKALAACAACAALVLVAYPIWRAAQPQVCLSAPPHAYILVEGAGGNVITEQNGLKVPAPDPDPAQPPRGDGPEASRAPDGLDTGLDGEYYANPGGGDVPVEEEPYNQYNALFENARLDQYPEWYGGAYIDYSDSGEPSRLVVCIVEGCHTPDLEQQIAEWLGAGVWSYRDVKYSRGYLQELMERLNGSWFLGFAEADKAISGWGIYEQENCIQMDCRDVPNDNTLAALGSLDPDGDAIQVRVFTGQTINTDLVKGPAPGGVTQPAADPSAEPTPPEEAMPAQYDTQPALVSDLPQAKYDVITEGE